MTVLSDPSLRLVILLVIIGLFPHPTFFVLCLSAGNRRLMETMEQGRIIEFIVLEQRSGADKTEKGGINAIGQASHRGIALSPE